MNHLAVSLLVLTSVFSVALGSASGGLFGCPTIRPSDNVATGDMAAYKTKFLDEYLPMKLYAAADEDISRPFSCIVFTKTGSLDQIQVSYYEDGAAGTSFMSSTTTWNADDVSFSLRLPKKGLLGGQRDNIDMTFYLKDDLNDFITLQSCEPRFLSHSFRTYSFLKATGDAADYEWRCVIEAVNSLYRVNTEPKGICE